MGLLTHLIQKQREISKLKIIQDFTFVRYPFLRTRPKCTSFREFDPITDSVNYI